MKGIDSAALRSFVAAPRFDERTVSARDTTVARISVVMPSFNQAAFIERSILSVLNQNYPNTELIIIDGGSSDGTLEVIRRYERFLAYWVSEKDNGQSHALNKGFARASGDIFGWQNSDDLFVPNAFATAARLLADARVQIVYSHRLSIDAQDTIIEKLYALRPRRPHFPYENIDTYNQTLLWRRQVHERFGQFDESLHRSMDTDLMLRLLLHEDHAGFCRYDGFLGAYRRHAAQKTDIAGVDQGILSEEAAIERKLHLPPRHSLAGMYYRIAYRASQIATALKFGGPVYTVQRAIRGARKRHGLF